MHARIESAYDYTLATMIAQLNVLSKIFLGFMGNLLVEDQNGPLLVIRWNVVVAMPPGVPADVLAGMLVGESQKTRPSTKSTTAM